MLNVDCCIVDKCWIKYIINFVKYEIVMDDILRRPCSDDGSSCWLYWKHSNNTQRAGWKDRQFVEKFETTEESWKWLK